MCRHFGLETFNFDSSLIDISREIVDSGEEEPLSKLEFQDVFGVILVMCFTGRVFDNKYDQEIASEFQFVATTKT